MSKQSSRLTGGRAIFASHKSFGFVSQIGIGPVPVVEPSNFLRLEALDYCSNCIGFELVCILWVTKGAILTCTLSTFASEISTDLLGHIFGKDICGFHVRLGKEEHTHV